ncbi:EamA family transporter [Streptosporangium sandarakinum]|uniref:DME family drug/metabolite transporter n=1 Tax=Streptosporangium sandarakinum TaxID=1260955 RepID=A0A852V447_9ACTN|nr:EamA family transporter [Streptosporangium sandarakinum]NYF42113.1 DME family drug/metabolite transporter [Streptosporangium sandarakinum]
MTHVSVRRGLLYVSIAATAWGTGGAAGALLRLSGGLDPVSISFWRFAAGAATLLPILHFIGRIRGRSQDRDRGHARESRRYGRIAATGVAMAICQTAYFAAVASSGLAVATVVTIGATPVFVAAAARLLLGERLGAAGLGSAAVALAGLAMLVLDGGPASFSAAGTGWALLSAVAYAGVTLLNRAFSAEPYAATFGGFAVGGLCLLPLALSGGLLPDGDPLFFWAAVAYLGVVPTALAYVLFFTGLGSVRATTASVISLVEPVGAAAIGILAFGERFTAQGVAGAALLLAAVALLALRERREPAPVTG